MFTKIKQLLIIFSHFCNDFAVYFAHFSNNFTNLIFFSHLLILNIYLCYNLITNIF